MRTARVLVLLLAGALFARGTICAIVCGWRGPGACAVGELGKKAGCHETQPDRSRPHRSGGCLNDGEPLQRASISSGGGRSAAGADPAPAFLDGPGAACRSLLPTPRTARPASSRPPDRVLRAPLVLRV